MTNASDQFWEEDEMRWNSIGLLALGCALACATLLAATFAFESLVVWVQQLPPSARAAVQPLCALGTAFFLCVGFYLRRRSAAEGAHDL